MASINTFTIVGNVTKDVELRYTPSGTPSVTFMKRAAITAASEPR